MSASTLNHWNREAILFQKDGNRQKQCFWQTAVEPASSSPMLRISSTASWHVGHFAPALVVIFKLPAFALADDGILIEHRGKILSASDWIPEDTSITSLTAEKGLCIRYPIRMQEDLLPVRHLTNDELVPTLKQALGVPDLDESLVAYILERQLRMEGTYILHSETAKKNGGDFDFDTICVMPSDQFPKFIAGRIAYGEKFQQEKTKHEKAKSPWWNVYLVAMKARGTGSVPSPI